MKNDRKRGDDALNVDEIYNDLLKHIYSYNEFVQFDTGIDVMFLLDDIKLESE